MHGDRMHGARHHPAVTIGGSAMIERNNNIIIDAEDWRLALLAIKRDILDAEPVAALRRIDAMLDQIAWCNDGAHMATKGLKSHHN
jgi:hypothetical protein